MSQTKTDTLHQTEYGFLSGYRRFWYNLDLLVRETTTQGKDVIKRSIKDLEETFVGISLPSLPWLAMIPNMFTLYLVLLPILGVWPTRFLTAMIEIIPFVISYFLFRSKNERRKTYLGLLIGYYAIVFALVVAYKVYIIDIGYTLQSLGWLLLPLFSVVAMLTYGVASTQVSEEEEATEVNSLADQLESVNTILKRLQRNNEHERLQYTEEIKRLQNEIAIANEQNEKLNATNLALKEAAETPTKLPVANPGASTSERRLQLLQILLQEHENAPLHEVNKSAIATRLGTSHTTISNDMKWLQKNKRIDLTQDVVTILKETE